MDKYDKNSKDVLKEMPPAIDIETGKKIKTFKVVIYKDKTVEETVFIDGTHRNIIIK